MDNNTNNRSKWGRAPMPALTDAERNAPLESWTERESRLTAERVTRMAARDAEMAAAFEAQMARARAWGCDDGAGSCQFCGVPLGVDATGAQTHPAEMACPGPGRTCDVCRKPWARDPVRGWQPACSPAEHEARARDVAWALATRKRNPLAPPSRVHRDGDDE